MKRFFTILFALLAVIVANAATLAVQTGSCGASLTWTLDSKAKTLVVDGSGAMTSAPWLDEGYETYVQYVTLPAGLTQIYEAAFKDCNVLELTVLSTTPPGGGTKSGIVASKCKLFVPENSAEFYEQAIWWDEFASITEIKPVVKPDYTVTLTTNDKYGSCTGAGTYKEGTNVEIEAIDDTHYHFTQWSDGNTDNPRTFVLTQDTAFEAVFAPNIYTVTVYSNDGTKGTVSGGGQYAYGSYASLTATAKEGYSVLGWSDGISYFCQTSASRSYYVSGNAELTANFGIAEPISGTCGENLTWTLDCSGTLTISGTGAMTNWTAEKEVPWYNNYKKNITRIVIEDGVTGIGSYAFYKLESVTEVQIGKDIVTIGANAFYGCKAITTLDLPQGLSSIGNYAFRNIGISSLTIPGLVTTIGNNAFYGCNNLKTIVCKSATPPTITSRILSTAYDYTFYVPCGALSAYIGDSFWYYKGWTYVEDGYNYVVPSESVVVLQEPTCADNTLIIKAIEQEGYFFKQWSDGNKENPRTVYIKADELFSVSPEFIKGIIMNVCAGYQFENPEDKKTYTINADQVIGDYYFYIKTSVRPSLSSAEYPVMQAGRLYYANAEKALRKHYAETNLRAAKITSVEWSYSVNADKTVDTYIKSDILPSDEYASVWVKYSAQTECGDSFADTLFIQKTPTAGKPASSQLSTNGKDFWVSSTIVCPPDRGNQFPPTPYIAVSAEMDCEVHIFGGVDNAVDITRKVTAGSWTEFREDVLDPAAWYPIHMYQANNVSSLAGLYNNYGLRITSTEDISVYVILSSVYAMDASNILPIASLGCEYYTQDYWAVAKEFPNVAGLTTILGTEDNTTIDITPNGNTYDGHLSGETYSITLNAGQTYYMVTEIGGLLSGTHIESRDGKKIAVFCGVPLINIPTGVSARDCLFEQALPVEYWGTQFIATRALEKNGNFIGITAAEDGTQVKVNGELYFTLDRGQTNYIILQGPANPYEYYTTSTYASSNSELHTNYVITADAMYIETSCPCAVFNYDTGNSFRGNYNSSPDEVVASKGDPSSVWVSPIQQKIERITFSTCYTTKTQDHFLNVIGETATCGQTKLTALYGSNPLDKTDLLEWKPVPGNPEYSYARAKIGDNSTRGYSVFRLENANGVIALVYGNGEDESYAYNVGSATIKRGVELNGITHVGAENTIESQFCLNDPIVLNAQVGTDAIDRIDWDFGDGKKMRSAPAQVEHQYAKAGAYTITAKLYTHKECPFTLYEPEDMIFHVQVGQPDTLRREYAICEGESFVHNGQLYAAPAQDTITYGCDSVEIFTVSKAECTTEVPDTVAIIPTEHEAEFTWPIIPYVFSYTLTIWIDEARTISLCTLTFNAAGQLVNIEFGSAFSNPTAYNSNYAPRRRRQQVIHVGTTTLDFTITGLENNHTYYYLLQALDATDIMVDSKEGHFTTGTYIIVTPDPSDPTDPLTPEPGEPSNPSNPSDPSEPSQEALDNTTIDLTPVKLLRSGQILILRDGKVYTVTGQEMK